MRCSRELLIHSDILSIYRLYSLYSVRYMAFKGFQKTCQYTAYTPIGYSRSIELIVDPH